MAASSGGQEEEARRLLDQREEEDEQGETRQRDAAATSDDAVDPQQPLHLTLLKPGEQSVVVEADGSWTLKRLSECAFTTSELAEPNQTLVIIYMGKRLKLDDLARTLAQLGVHTQTSMHFLLQHKPPDQAPPAVPSAPAAMDASSLNRDSFQSGYQAPHDGGEQLVPDMAYYDDDAWLAPAERRGTPFEFFLGAMMGLLLGVLAVIWLLQPNLSRMCRLGVCFGVAANFTLGMSRYFLLHPEMRPHHKGEDEATRGEHSQRGHHS